MCSFNKCVLLVLCATLTLVQAVAQAASFVDVLELPAKPSALAVRSPLLDVTRAVSVWSLLANVATFFIPTMPVSIGSRPPCRSAPI